GRDLALGVYRQLLLQVAVGHCSDHLDDAAYLLGKVIGHYVDVVGEVLPCPGDAWRRRLAAKLALAAHLARHPRHLRGERAQLIHHRVDGLLEEQDLATHIHRNLAREIAIGHRDGYLGDVAYLLGKVIGHYVDVVGEVLP